MNPLATLLTTYQTIPVADRENPARRQELLSVVEAVIGKQDDLVNTCVTLLSDNTLLFTLHFKPSWLADTKHEARIDLKVRKKDYSVQGVIVDNSDRNEAEKFLSEWGNTDRKDSGFDLKKFPSYATPIYFTLCLLKDMYKRKFNSILKNTDPDLAHAVNVSALIKPHIEKIKELCAKNCVSLWIDMNLNSTQDIAVLPNSANIEADVFQTEAEIKDDRIPYLDLGLRSYDSSYDHFVYPEKNKKIL